jgi:hypothetical protein
MRRICDIASEIKQDWRVVNFGAVPYLDAMLSLNDMDDTFICDSAREIVLRFLSNANGYRGETAKRVKAELKAMLK